MPRGNTRFTARVKTALKLLHNNYDLELLPTKSASLFSPVLHGDYYEWVKVMVADGLLVGRRKVREGEGANPMEEVEILIGIVIQSEDSTSQGKPDPIGKAAIGHIANGIWIDIEKRGRRRLDRVHVLMLLPEGAAPAKKKKYETARRNAENAASFMPDCHVLSVSRKTSGEELASEIEEKIRRHLKGRGRPKTR